MVGIPKFGKKNFPRGGIFVYSYFEPLRVIFQGFYRRTLKLSPKCNYSNVLIQFDSFPSILTKSYKICSSICTEYLKLILVVHLFNISQTQYVEVMMNQVLIWCTHDWIYQYITKWFSKVLIWILGTSFKNISQNIP